MLCTFPSRNDLSQTPLLSGSVPTLPKDIVRIQAETHPGNIASQATLTQNPIDWEYISGKRWTQPTALAGQDPQEQPEKCLDVAPRHEAGRPTELEAVPAGGAVDVQEIPNDMDIRRQA